MSASQCIVYLTYHLHRVSEACDYSPDARDVVLPEGDEWWDDDGFPKKLILTYRTGWKGACSRSPLVTDLDNIRQSEQLLLSYGQQHARS